MIPSQENQKQVETTAAIAITDISMDRNALSPFPTAQEIPEQHRLDAPKVQRRFLMNGETRTWDGAMQDVPSPICLKLGDGTIEQQEVGKYPLMSAQLAKEAVDAAASAYDYGLGEWPSMSAEARIASIEKFTDGMLARKDEIVKLIIWEIGKTAADAEKEFDRTVQYIRNSIVELRKLEASSEALISEEGVVAKAGHKPRGVVLCMGPSNYPLNETFTTLIPALLMGNTVVFKPPKLGVLLFEPLLDVFRDSFPKGVVNTVYGDGREVISPIMQSGKVDVFAFIGGSSTAEKISQLHPHRNRMWPVLGLGAKNPGIVLPDANIEETVKECVTAALSFNGQRCTALKILFVHSSIADEFAARLAGAVDELKAGMPWDKGVKITPLYEPGKPQYFTELVDDACAKGAEVINPRGGKIDHTLFYPAVVYPVQPGSRLYSEEQFGPVVPIARYDDIREVLKYMKESDFSQQASIFGADDATLEKVAGQVAMLTSRVNINTQCQRGPDSLPFTGTRDSAVGTLSLSEALKIFSTDVVIAGKENPKTRAIVQKS
jgi:glyceraldehyde-3-phosphate dehydrogenase (NADP+)